MRFCATCRRGPRPCIRATARVTLPAGGNQTSKDATVSPSFLVFNSTSWAEPQNITVTALLERQPKSLSEREKFEERIEILLGAVDCSHSNFHLQGQKIEQHDAL